MPARLARRALVQLAAAAALGTVGCRSLPLHGHATTPPVTLPIIGAVPSDAAQPAGMSYTDYVRQVFGPVLASFNAAQSGVRAVLANSADGFHNDDVGVGVMVAGEPTVQLLRGAEPAIDLSGPMRQLNWDPPALLPGFAAEWNGRLLGVPFMYTPTAVRIDVAAWRAAGMDLPGPTWTAADFTSACEILQAAPGRTGSVLGGGFPFTTPEVWPGWVLGYGGQLVSDGGQVVLTDGGAREGVAALTAAVRAARPNMCAPTGDMAFVFGGQTAALPAAGDQVALARFPVLPARPVIPTLIWSYGLPTRFPHPESAAAFLAWMVSPAGQTAMVAAGFPTVRVDGPPGTASWAAAFPAGYDLGGLMPNAADLRPIPWQLDYLGVVLNLGIWQALDAVDDQSLMAVLSRTEQDCNAALALPVAQQAAYLGKFNHYYVVPANRSSGSLGCANIALTMPSRYATAEPVGASSGTVPAAGPQGG